MLPMLPMLPMFFVTASTLAGPIQEGRMDVPAERGELKIEEPARPHLIPAVKAGELPCDSKDKQGVLLGVTTREAILSHRSIFSDNTKHRTIKPDWASRWKGIDVPCTLVVVFGSWCSDSQAELPDLLALAKEPNPFIKLHYIGVYRDKTVEASAWPKGIAPQAIEKVPTVWLYELQAGGAQKLLGSIVETPPKGQRMAEAVLDLLEKAR